MNLKKLFTFKYIIFATVLLVGTFLSISGDFIDSNTLFKIPTELNLSTWIDGDGKKTESVRLIDYRGKVVYLYFFQDW
jgi:hypothetical protein